jgi:hypothetical protein
MDKQNNDWRNDFQLREDIESWFLSAEIFYHEMLNKKINFLEFESLKIELREHIFDYIKERENKNAK